MNHYAYTFPAGRLWIAAEGGSVTEVSWVPIVGEERETPATERAARQLEEYFAGRRTAFDVPLLMRGTDFQRRVWALLGEIPFGEVRTYGQIATLAGNPAAGRAVGMACNRNPVSIIVPCHRVVGAGGGLTGYAGGLNRKEFLLNLEGVSRRCPPRKRSGRRG
jgi:methylated-DNA-[protein]-cysteine S-methyltransferase